MSKHAGFLYHPLNNHMESIYTGFSWPCLLFGPFWFLYKGMIALAIMSFFAAGITFGFSTVVFPFLANNQHYNHLLKKGYLNTPREDE